MTLKDILPAQYRKVVYSVYAVLGFLIGATQVGFATAGEDQPVWLLVALSVLGYTGVALGVVAGSNVTPTEPVEVAVVEEYQGQHERDQFGAVDTRTIAVVALVVAVLVVLALVL